MTTPHHRGMGKLRFRVVLLILLWLPETATAQAVAPASTGSETRRYGIDVAGIQVGTMTATRQAQGADAMIYTLVSDVKVNFLVYKLRIYYKVVDVFWRGRLQRSTVEAHTNRGDFSSLTEWKTDHYDIVAEQYKHSYRAVERNPIALTVTNLYFTEPAGQATAFTEYFGDYFALSPGKTPGTYRARREGREDEYQYERGQLVKIIKKNPLKNFVINLRP